MTTTIIIQSAPYQPPPDGPNAFADSDQCTYCHRLPHSECPECHLPVCQHHAFINPETNQPPLCPDCLRVARMEIAAEIAERAAEYISKAISPKAGGHLYGSN